MSKPKGGNVPPPAPDPDSVPIWLSPGYGYGLSLQDQAARARRLDRQIESSTRVVRWLCALLALVVLGPLVAYLLGWIA